ncbi:MAG: hypothetical protein HOM11_04190 [Methylococcales bacterium]|jgi:uncharacterized protein|nr:hypothetical protein [Methylococcales bacterium]MBT7443638.1 hypothetical protein [Methylococcales bacterium]
MSNRIPERINAKLFARTERGLNGQYAVQSFGRLNDIPQSAGEVVAFEVEFSFAPNGHIQVKGHVSGTLQLMCQRCMQPFDYSVKTEFLLAVIESEHLAESLPEQYEPYVVGDSEELQVQDLIEDELILALPIIPKHEHDCIAKFREKPPVEEPEERKNPFAVLETLKQK